MVLRILELKTGVAKCPLWAGSPPLTEYEDTVQCRCWVYTFVHVNLAIHMLGLELIKEK